MTALCVTVTLLGFGAYVANKEAQRAEQKILDTAQGMAAEIARLAPNHIVLRDYAGLEKNLIIISFRILPLRDIMVIDPDGRVLSHVEHLDGDVRPRFQQIKLTPPRDLATKLEVEGETIIAWHPIVLGYASSWVRVRFSLAPVVALKHDVYTNTALAAILASTLCALLLVAFLAPRLRALKKVTAFANKLDSQLGEQLVLPPNSVEVDTLAHALNRASKTIAEDEKSLRASEARLRSVIENMPVMLAAFNANGEAIVWNKECERVTGYAANEVLAKPAIAHRVCHDTARVHPSLRTEKPGSAGQGRELRVQSKSGENKTISWTDISDAFPIPGWVSWYIGIDVTDKVASERVKNDFISTVNHELRTPLTSIRGSLRLLAAGVAGAMAPQAQDMLRIADRNTERLLRLVTDILDIQRMEAGEFQLAKRPLDVVELARETVRANGPFASQRNVALKLETFVGAAEVFADSDRLEQVITNFISNAVKHSGAGETVVTTIIRTDAGVRIEVTDSGPGIPEEFKSKIFGRFARADSSDASKVGGTGLGLFISRTIVEQHDGTIGFSSTPGKGTTFYAELPALRESVVQTVTSGD